MYDTCTVFGGYEVADYNAESVSSAVEGFDGVAVGEELVVADAVEVAAFAGRDEGISRLVFAAEIAGERRLGEDNDGVGMGIGILGGYDGVVYIGADGEACVAGERPRGSRPSEEMHARRIGRDAVCGFWVLLVVLVIYVGGYGLEGGILAEVGDFKHSDDGGIFHGFVAAGLVELVRGEASASGGGERLDSIAFVEEVFVVEFLEEVPDGLDVVVFVGNVGVFEVNPVAHFDGECVPAVFEFHDGTAALGVIGFDADFGADVFFGDAEFLFDGEFDGEAVRVPACFAADEAAFHGLEAAEGIFDAAGEYVVDAGHTVSGGRAFVEHERGLAFALADAAVEYIILLPEVEGFAVELRQIELVVLGVILFHSDKALAGRARPCAI